MSDVIRSGNPVLSQGLNSAPSLGQWSNAAVMSVSGTAVKTMILLGLVLLTGGYSFYQTLEAFRNTGDVFAGLQQVQVLAGVGLISAFVSCLVMCYAPSWSPVLAPVYALGKGLALGLISGLAETRFHGIVAQAVLLSISVLGLMLFLYANGTLRATPALTKGILVCTFAVFVVYLVTMVMNLFGMQMPYIHGNGPIGIAFSLFVVGLAAFNFIIDFDAIQQGAENGAPKYMEWYCGFGLLVTLLWLYVEILRLLMKLNSSRD
jgi:uncharacterized YccA/Bax inhibitor family protein